ncbi:MAG: hypothetical protein VX147_06535 [Bacteroidota bacterium]|nr:hypothetical protein [Bacteroidota bacterium]
MDSYFKNNIVVREFLSKEEIGLWNQNSQSYLTNTAFINHFEGLNKEETKPIYISYPKGHLFGHIIKLSGKKIGNYYAREKPFSLKRVLFSPISLHFFCFGNTHLSNVKYNINTEKLSINELSDIIDVIQKKYDITFFLIPDHLYGELNENALKSHQSFHVFDSEPDMTLSISPNWHTIYDYLNDINSKYKKRYRSIHRKSSSIHTIEINNENFNNHRSNINSLYQNVFVKSSFSGPPFNVSIFKSFFNDKHLGFKMIGYQDQHNQLLSFSTYFIVDKTLYSYYIGLDYPMNSTYQLYNRMLYDMLEIGIRNRVNKVIYGRTAAELKSTIGAVPTPSTSAIYISNRILNVILKPFVSKLALKKWIQRDPFKSSYINA